MFAPMTHYYFLKKVMNELDPLIKMKFNYTEDELFFDATFNDLPMYNRQFAPFKRDRYMLYEKLHNEQFLTFFKEVIKILKEKQGYDNLLLVYGIISHYILDEHLKQFFWNKTKLYLPYGLICKSVDQYYSLKFETIDLLNVRLTKRFKNGFTCEKYVYKLIHWPLMRAFNFFGKEDFFVKCCKRKSFYYKHIASNLYLKHFFSFLDLFSSKKEKKLRKISFVYPSTKKIRIDLFNLDHKDYYVDKMKYNYSIDDIYENAYQETKKWIDAINKFMFFNQEKALRNLLQMPKDEEL